MVATWNPAASSSYYTAQTEYYQASGEPLGVWYAPTCDFKLVDGAIVDHDLFERLYAAVDERGRSMLGSSRVKSDRIPAFDVTLSAPRSVSLAWAFASPELKIAIETAQHSAVRAALAVVEREACFARRGRNGERIEKVSLTAAVFQHGESRPAEHADGRVFADPNLHSHAVILSLATRADGTVGALHSMPLRRAKMLAGAVYHAELAHQLEALGFGIDRIRKNGTFELVGCEDSLIEYYSARRREIEDELGSHGVKSAQAVGLAAAIAKSTRAAKTITSAGSRERFWAEALADFGLNSKTFSAALIGATAERDREAAETLLQARLEALPAQLTETSSVIDRYELLRAVNAAVVGTGLAAQRAEIEFKRLIAEKCFVEIGHDATGLPQYSTPEMVAIETEIVAIAQRLVDRTGFEVDRVKLEADCRQIGLNAEQRGAALAATSSARIAVIEGAPGSGKTTTLNPIIQAYHKAGYRVVGSAAAWRIAKMLETELHIESRATASWLEKSARGQTILDSKSVFVVDEAGLVASRDMHAILRMVEKTGAKLLLVGDRDQLQAIGAGPGLDLVTRAVESARTENIVRQKEAWAREAVQAFGRGDAEAALNAFAERGYLVEAEGSKATINALVDAFEADALAKDKRTSLILAKSNTQVGAISREIRSRMRERGELCGPDVELLAATPSGHPTKIELAAGDAARFLIRNDELSVINGTTAKILAVAEKENGKAGGRSVEITAQIDDRIIRFDPSQLADDQGRARIGWAYASTIAGAQGLTVDLAYVLTDQTFDRHDIYVASSRAREKTTLFIDATSIDRRLQAERPLDQQNVNHPVAAEERRTALAKSLSRSNVKLSTVSVIEASRAAVLEREKLLSRTHGHDLAFG